MSLEQRVARLEDGDQGARRKHVVVKYEGDTDEVAIDHFGRAKVGPRDSILYVLIRNKRRGDNCLIETAA